MGVAPAADGSSRKHNWGKCHDSNHCVGRPARRIDDGGGTPRHLRFFARHRVRVVRLLHLRHARRDPGGAVLRRRQPVSVFHLHPACFCRGLCGSSVWGVVLRPAGRSDRPQIHVSHHHDADGSRDLLHRYIAGLCQLGHRGTGGADLLASVSGIGARRRIWRRRDLRRRACSQEQARSLYVVDSNNGDAWPVHGLADRPRRAHLHGRQFFIDHLSERAHDLGVRRLGMAYPVPAVCDSARGIDLDPAQAQ